MRFPGVDLVSVFKLRVYFTAQKPIHLIRAGSDEIQDFQASSAEIQLTLAACNIVQMIELINLVMINPQRRTQGIIVFE